MTRTWFQMVVHTIGRIDYKDNSDWCITELPHGNVILQHTQVVQNVDHILAIHNVQRGRQWYIEKGSSSEHILKTALHAVEAFEKHEARENFKVDGVRVDNPHRTWLVPTEDT